jgi:hypothetical protein
LPLERNTRAFHAVRGPDLPLKPVGGRRQLRMGGVVIVLIVLACILINLLPVLSGLREAATSEPTSTAIAAAAPAITVVVLTPQPAAIPARVSAAGSPEAAPAIQPTAMLLPASATAVDTARPQPQLAVRTGNDYVNVRGGPGLNYVILGRLNAAQTAPVIGKSPDAAWWQIVFEDQHGWVYAPLVRLLGEADVPIVRASAQP